MVYGTLGGVPWRRVCLQASPDSWLWAFASAAVWFGLFSSQDNATMMGVDTSQVIPIYVI